MFPVRYKIYIINKIIILVIIIINAQFISLFFLDTRTTQWEDPRLNNPNIAGPVNNLIFF